MAKLEEKHLEYLSDFSFKDFYLNDLNERLSYFDKEIEEDRQKALELLLTKVNYIYKLSKNYINELNNEKKLEIDKTFKNNYKITDEFIINLANTINKHGANGYISKGYRKIDNNLLLDNKYPIEKSINIDKRINELLDKYYNNWSNLDIFEREAKFVSEFLLIHPFEDGNRRTSRLLLNYNLLIQGHAPIIFKYDDTRSYFIANTKDEIDKIKKLYENESKKEKERIDILIKTYNELNERNHSI